MKEYYVVRLKDSELYWNGDDWLGDNGRHTGLVDIDHARLFTTLRGIKAKITKICRWTKPDPRVQAHWFLENTEIVRVAISTIPVETRPMEINRDNFGFGISNILNK